jgi:recombination protein RecA
VPQLNKALEKTKHGGSVYTGDQHPELKRVRTGIMALDYVLGGGIPLARATQFTGEEGAGKTLAALHVTAAFQRQDKVVLWLNRRGAEDFDPVWARKQGVDVNKLVIVGVAAGDVALEAAVTMINHGLADLVVCDSIQTFGTTRELEGAVDDESYAGAGAPQMWGRVMRKWIAALNSGKSEAALLLISQVRAPIGVNSGKGTPEPQGSQIRAIRHFKAIDVRFRQKYDEDAVEGQDEDRIRHFALFVLKGDKQKTSDQKGEPTQDRVSSFVYHFRPSEGVSMGVDNVRTMLRLAASQGVVQVSGAWYSGFGLKYQGEKAYLAALRKRPKTCAKIEAALLGEPTPIDVTTKREALRVSKQLKRTTFRVVLKQKSRR